MIEEKLKNITFTPTPADSLQNYLWTKIDNTWNSESYEYVLRKNIAYNFQYLQYLDFEINKDPDRHVVITKMLYKTFIIVAFGIIEALIYHDLKKKKLIKKEEYEEIGKYSNHIKDSDLRINTSVFKKKADKDLVDEFVKTKDLFKRAQDNDLFGNDNDLYAKMNGMRKLRDKVHIHITDQQKDTDYNMFNRDSYIRNKETFLFIYSVYFGLEDLKLEI